MNGEGVYINDLATITIGTWLRGEQEEGVTIEASMLKQAKYLGKTP